LPFTEEGGRKERRQKALAEEEGPLETVGGTSRGRGKKKKSTNKTPGEGGFFLFWTKKRWGD